jgi:GTP-binding protein Era
MTDTGDSSTFRSGYATLVGRPNVGKSTLLNALIGEKVSIVTPKPQTTRHRILGIDNADDRQIVFVDTPGLHRSRGRAINRAMNRAASGAVVDADVIVMVVEALRWTEEDQDVLDRCRSAGLPIIVAVNKVDLVKPKDRLLPYIDSLASRAPFHDIVPVSATRGINVDALRSSVVGRLPEGSAFFPADARSDRDDRFRISEIIREKLTLRLHEEIPYGLAVEVENLEFTPGLIRAGAVIWVERPGQKPIVIGKGGAQLKACGKAARHELEQIYGRKVHLELWVKIRKKWSDSDQALKDLGIDME